MLLKMCLKADSLVSNSEVVLLQLSSVVKFAGLDGSERVDGYDNDRLVYLSEYNSVCGNGGNILSLLPECDFEDMNDSEILEKLSELVEQSKCVCIEFGLMSNNLNTLTCDLHKCNDRIVIIALRETSDKIMEKIESGMVYLNDFKNDIILLSDCDLL